MIDPEREELLSAYLDGEVSPEERTRVERWLAESGELRQLRDELLAMRTDLQALPRHQVGHDLAAVVMHRSDSARIPDQSSRSAPATDVTDASESTQGNFLVEWWNRGSQGRRYLWPALAVAAALAILVFDARQRPDEFEVAQAPQVDGASAPAGQPSIGGTSKIATPESAAPPALDSDSAVRGSIPSESPRPRSAELRPPTERVQDGFGTMREPAPADIAPQERSLKKSPASAEFFATQAEQASQALAVETIICPVTPRYLEERKFEKLLDDHQVVWKQVPIPPQMQMQTGPLASGTAPLQSLYFLQADSRQLNKLLSQVPQGDKLVEGNRDVINRQGPSKTAANGQPSGVQVMLVAPVDARGPATPAAKPAR